MAYRVDIEHDFERRAAMDALGSLTVRFVLGEDISNEYLYFMGVSFVHVGRGIYEIRFGIEERELERLDWTVGLDYSIECSKRYVPKEHRPCVLEYVLECILVILSMCDPSQVAMRSFHAHLHDRAMIKYRRICALMAANGFIVATDERDGTSGKHYWLFKRP